MRSIGRALAAQSTWQRQPKPCRSGGAQPSGRRSGDPARLREAEFLFHILHTRGRNTEFFGNGGAGPAGSVAAFTAALISGVIFTRLRRRGVLGALAVPVFCFIFPAQAALTALIKAARLSKPNSAGNAARAAGRWASSEASSLAALAFRFCELFDFFSYHGL